MLRYSIYGVVSFDLRLKKNRFFFCFLRYGRFSHSGSHFIVIPNFLTQSVLPLRLVSYSVVVFLHI